MAVVMQGGQPTPSPDRVGRLGLESWRRSHGHCVTRPDGVLDTRGRGSYEGGGAGGSPGVVIVVGPRFVCIRVRGAGVPSSQNRCRS